MQPIRRLIPDKGNRNDDYRVSRGFTLVELSLSLVFISTLSLAVVLVIAGAVSSYHKSITMNQINTTGTNLVDDMRYAVQQSSPSKLTLLCDKVYGASTGNSCLSDNGHKFVSVSRSARVAIGGNELDRSIPVFGAFCTGTYSYIWNSGYYFGSDYEVKDVAAASLKYNGDKTISNFKLLKVADKDRAVCVAAVRVRGGRATSNYSDSQIESEFNIALDGLVGGTGAITLDEEPLELLGGGEDGMALYNLEASVSEQAGIAKNMFYYASFVLGTVQGGINVVSGGDYCQAPEDYSTDMENFEYCAINKFNFAAMANGRKV